MRASPMLLASTLAFALTACGDAVRLTEAERATCDQKVAELLGRKAAGEDVSFHVRTTNGTKTARIVYLPTSDFPGAQCDLLEGKIVSITKFEQIFPAPGEKI